MVDILTIGMLTFCVIFKAFALAVTYRSIGDEVPIEEKLHAKWLANGFDTVATILILVSAILMIVGQW